jgi:hypothetical protein
LLDLVPRHLDFIALSFTIRIVEALGASAATTAAFAITAAVFPDSVATTFVSICAVLLTGLTANDTSHIVYISFYGE